MITITSVDAQNRFGQLLDTAQREPITITRRGRPVAMLLAVDAFEARQQQEAGASASAHAARQSIAAFRGTGRGTTVEQLLADRRAEARAEAAFPARSPSAPSTRNG